MEDDLVMKPTTYGERVKWRMDQLGLGITEVARAIDRTPSAVWAWVAEGSERLPNIASRRAVAECLRVDPDWLMTGEGPVPTLRDYDAAAPSEERAMSIKVLTETFRADVARQSGYDVADVHVTIRIGNTGGAIAI